DVAEARRFLGRGGMRLRAELGDEIVERLRPAGVADGDVVAGVDEQPRHRPADVACADDSDVHGENCAPPSHRMKRNLLLACTLLLMAAAPPPRDVLPDLQHERVDYWVDQFSHSDDYRPKIAAAFARKANVQKMITAKLRARGLPQNLIYLAMEESALNPRAHSSEEAVGLWQLTRDTARLYGLRVNKKVDERRN